MEVVCSGCNSKFNIPDDKVPKNQTTRINCPKCNDKIIIDPREKEGDTDTRKSNAPIENDSDDYSLDYYDETKLALIMADENINNTIRSAVEEKGYKFITVPNIREALLKLRFHQFDLIILVEGFDGQSIAGGPIMNYLNHLQMPSRRSIFLTLIGERYQTMDEMMAFALSANMVVNTKDIGSFASILKRGMGEHEKFYKVFLETLEKEGKI